MKKPLLELCNNVEIVDSKIVKEALSPQEIYSIAKINDSEVDRYFGFAVCMKHPCSYSKYGFYDMDTMKYPCVVPSIIYRDAPPPENIT